MLMDKLWFLVAI